MKILPILICLPLAACTMATGDRTAGKYFFGSVGGDVEGLNQTPDGISAGAINNSASFKSAVAAVKGMWTGYLTAAGLKYSLGKYYGHEGKVVDADKAVKLEELRNAKSAEQGRQALEALKLEHAAPVP